MKDVELKDMYVSSIQKSQSNFILTGFAFLAVVFTTAYWTVELMH